MTDDRSRGFDWLGLLVLGLAGAYFASLVRYGFHLGEDGDVIYLPYRAFSGQRPYVDFASAYAPGFFYFNAALFRLFGVNIVVLRWAMAAINSLAIFGLYRIARAVVPPALAVVPAFGYAAVMLVFPGEYASFNVPYPAWHVVLAWVASTLALLRASEGRGVGWVFVAGALAGVGCAFKPNTGAFNLAALALIVMFVAPARNARWDRVLAWGLVLGVLASIAAAFGGRVVNRDARLLLWPVFTLGGLAAMASLRRTDRPTGSMPFVGAVGALLGGFALVTVPWVLFYWMQLGSDRFLRDVLYVGSSYELFFYLPIREIGAWDAAVVAAGIGLLVVGHLMQREMLPRRVVIAAIVVGVVAGAVGLWLAPMPEGFLRAITQRLQYLSFGVAILAHWAGVAYVSRAVFAPRTPINAAAIAIAVGAPLLFLSIYPRSDFFHWVLSAPVTLVLFTLLYWRVVRSWLPATGWTFVAAAPAYAVVLVLAWPGLVLATRVQTAGQGTLAELGLARAPIVLEAGRRSRLDALRDAVQFITAHSDDRDTLLGFPNLHLLNLLSGRQVPGRFGSFSPGWPDHVVEAGVVNDLRRRQTPLIAVNRDPQLYMGHAPLYFFLLRTYVRQHYELAARIGGYDILRRRGAAQTEARVGQTETEAAAIAGPDCGAALDAAERDMPERAASLAACWRTADAALQERAVAQARATRDPRDAVALAEALRDGRLAPRAALQAVRVLGALADARSLPALVAARSALAGRTLDELNTAIFNLTTRAVVAGFAFESGGDEEAAVRADAACGAAAVAWLEPTEMDPRLRFAGAWIAGARRESAAVPGLRRLLAEADIGLQSVAADALIRMGAADDIVEPLLDGLSHDEMLLPSHLLAWSVAHPVEARQRLAQTLEHGNALQRETVTFIAGALGDRALAEALRPGVGDPNPRIRIASIWALGMLGFEAARADIERVERDDPTDLVRQFARASLQWLDEDRRRHDG